MNTNMKSKKLHLKTRQLLNPNKRLFSTLFSICLTMTSLHSAQAEDIEIYDNLINSPLSSNPVENDPNILFVLDTSGSMRAREVVKGDSILPPYDPSFNYVQAGTLIDSPDDNIYVYGSGDMFSGAFVAPSENNCSTATASFTQSLNDGSEPRYEDSLILWIQEANRGEWRSAEAFPDGSIGDISALECEEDFGNHGLNDGDAEVFPQNQEATNTTFEPNYTDNENDGNLVSFENEASSGFLALGNYHDYLQADETVLFERASTDITPVPALAGGASGAANFCSLGGNGGRTRDNVFGRDLSDNAVFQCQTRMGILKRTMTQLAGDLNNVNLGIMRLNERNGGSLASAVRPIGQSRQEFINRVLNLPAQGFTPVTETMYEAYAYFAGLDVLSETQGKWVAVDEDDTSEIIAVEPDAEFINTSERIDDLGVTGTPNNLTFTSPINNQCQDNSIILFSDGLPTRDGGFITQIGNFIGSTACQGGNGACLDELTGAMADPSIDVNTSVSGIQSVFTYTIGFGSGVAGNNGAFLQQAANAGSRPGSVDPQFFVASDSDSLTEAFLAILADINNSSTAGAFAGAAVSVDTSNRLQNNNELYFALFEASGTPRWNGNVKGYTINGDGDILDSTGAEAINDEGEFDENSRSFWSDAVDGGNVLEGGFNAELDVTLPGRERNLFASLETDSDVVTLFKAEGPTEAEFDAAAIDLVTKTDAANVLLGAENPANKLEIARWTLGIDERNERLAGATAANFFSGESLHGSPLVVSYNDDRGDDVLFSLTNQGLLHAIRAEDDQTDGGRELWSYIPDPDLFRNLGAYFNNALDGPKAYGLDSGITTDIDRNLNSDVTRARLYFGQRRGGDKYFAVDVTNANDTVVAPTPPVVGGTPGDGTGGDVIEKEWTLTTNTATQLGETWARPVPAIINYCDNGTCDLREVLVISGGYDSVYDGVVTTDPDTLVSTLNGADLSDIVSGGNDIKGNAIYIIDPNNVANGEPEILWQAGLSGEVINNERDFSSPDMLHSFPSEASMIDVDFDGVSDVMFISDIAGQVWRFDFKGHYTFTGDAASGDLNIVFDENDITSGNNNVTDSEEVSGGIIADLSENDANRRFYNALDVTVSQRTETDTGDIFPARFNIALGSGYRAHPIIDEGVSGNGGNNNENNRFYVVFDLNLTGPQPVFTNGEPTGAITYNYDNGSQIEGDNFVEIGLNGLDATLNGDHRNGFIVELETGTAEKVLNPSVTFGGVLIFTTYVPAVQGTQLICEPDIGSSRQYLVNLNTGTTVSEELSTPGLVAGPQILVISTLNDQGEVETQEPVLLNGLDGENLKDKFADLPDAPTNIGGLDGTLSEVNWWEIQGKN